MDLEVEGRHALLFDDDAAAAFVNSPEALVPWNDDAALLIDRYDVRHLLDRIPSRSSRLRPIPPSRLEETAGCGVSQSELDLERYLDLPPLNDGDGGDSDSETTKRSEATGSGAYRAVPIFYGDINSVADTKHYDSGSTISVFHPPFTVPESLLNNLPPTEKLHQIIARTAIFVSEHGGQSEIVLRVKQGDNPTFGFLMPDHHLHAYFRYLVDHSQLLKQNTNSSETQEKELDNRENEAHIAAGGALSLLGSVYGSGDDDVAVAVQPDFKEMKPINSNIAGNTVIPHRSEQEDLSISTASEDKGKIKHLVAAAVKEIIISSKSNHGVSAAPSSAPSSKKAGDAHALTRDALDASASQSSQSDINPVILEPPSFLKGAIDKIVEFIIRNGKEFEAILIEQDKTSGRFPFLLPSNLYHSYYLKILDDAREAKLLGKNLSDQEHDEHTYVGIKRRRQESPTKGNGAYVSNSAEQSDGRKEKFRMIIGGAKKDTRDQRPTPGRKSGLSADEVAAIVLAATRGSSPSNADRRSPTPARQSGASTDEAAAIVLAATRGSTPVNSLQSMPMDESETGRHRTRDDSGQASSIGSFSSLQGRNPITKPLSLPVGLSAGSTGELDRRDGSGGTVADVLVAKTIAKTVALAVSSEADSSEASLTKDQKLKAERLKRAKMFAAMIKSGAGAVTDSTHSASARSGSLELSNAASIVDKEREGSTVPFDAEISERGKPQVKDPIYDINRENRSRKSHLSRSRDHVDGGSDKDHNTSRKKHRSKDHSHHNKDYHRHQKNHSTSKDTESRHHNYRRGPSSRHRHRDDLSEDGGDEERKRSDRHRRKHRSHSEKQRDSEVDSKVKTSNHLDDLPLSSSSVRHEEAGMAGASDTRPINATEEVPSDLRAKIRAMLLETM